MQETTLKEFIDWLRYCGEDAFYVFDNTDEAIHKYLSEINLKN